MFGLTIVDHVRLNLTQAGENYTIHARAAERLANRSARVRIGVLALIAAATVASILGLVAGARGFQIAAVVATSLALLCYAAYVAWGFEGRVHAHRTCAHQLWLVCERYRSLLAEVRDGLLDREAILRRRDDLVLQSHSAYATAFPLDQTAYEALRHSREGKGDAGFNDSQADSLVA